MAIHRAAYLSDPRTDHAGRTLLLTFNNSLVRYLDHLASTSTHTFTVETYHKFARGYLASRGLIGNNSILNDREALIARALSTIAAATKAPILARPLEFFEEEFTWISSHGISSINDYTDAERVGRASRAPRTLRPLIWGVFEEYRRLRSLVGFRYDWDDLATAVVGAFEGDTAQRRYKHIIIDEGQDFSPQMLKSLATAIQPGGSLTFFGDTAQQIYGQRMSWKTAGLQVQHREIIRFEANYRNTKAVAALALAIASMPYYAGTPDMVAPKQPTADGPKPALVSFMNEAEEARFAVERAIAAATNRSVAILVRRREDEGLLKALLPSGSVRLHRNMPSWRGGNGIRYGTYHAAKGLEFDQVFLPFVSAARMPNQADRTAFGDEEATARDGKLLYVGVTRAKSDLVLSFSGEPSALLPANPALYAVASIR